MIDNINYIITYKIYIYIYIYIYINIEDIIWIYNYISILGPLLFTIYISPVKYII